MTPCRQLVLAGKATTDDWFPAPDKPYGKVIENPIARAACASCPYAEPCLNGAIERGEQYGIWGGVDFGNRTERRRARKASTKPVPVSRARRAVRRGPHVVTGTALRDARTAAGLTQADLADLLDVSAPQVCHWETGKLPIPPQRRDQLLDVLDAALSAADPDVYHHDLLRRLADEMGTTVAA